MDLTDKMVVVPFTNDEVWHWSSYGRWFLRDAVWHWFDEMGMDRYIYQSSTDDRDEGLFLFKDVNDAILFKLAWIGL